MWKPHLLYKLATSLFITSKWNMIWTWNFTRRKMWISSDTKIEIFLPGVILSIWSCTFNTKLTNMQPLYNIRQTQSFIFHHLSPYVLRSSGISRKSGALIVEYSQKRNVVLLFFQLFWESFNYYNFGTTGPIQVRFSAKCTSPNEDFNQIENWKCQMFDFRLIPLDRLTYIYWLLWVFYKQINWFQTR